MIIELPNGLLEGVDRFDYAEIDELRGKQQNYLADKDLVIGNIGHVPKILEDMILSLQTKEGVKWQGSISSAVNRLTSGDIETILIKVRENTYGPKFYHEAECPHCGKLMKHLRLDLDSLVLDKLSVEEMTKENKIVLPKSNLEVELKPTYLKDLFDTVKIISKKTDSLITSAVAISLKRIGSKSPVTSEDVENLPTKDLMFISEYLENNKLEGSIDTDIELECDNPKCKKEFSIKLNSLDPAFFVPTRGSTN